MTKSELIEDLADSQYLPLKDAEYAVKIILDEISSALCTGERVEIRGFGSFNINFRMPRQGRNPKTGETVSLDGRFVPHFKAGKELRDRVNEAFEAEKRFG